MVEDKVGIKEYLGIKINYSNETNLDKFMLDIHDDRDQFFKTGESKW